ncbi:hypothetical protein KPL37_02905 [Clostridium frigoris]|uniref:Uncharacterized protein n=1 Tax=Clostridium frigoris TaxID=205327 RepID=A0ABS6BRW9_9CLOT|nr:hypothetical protein [Clostridium frigoris]MBU3158724.1 hypothetical protein [Clostridium frigoris]
MLNYKKMILSTTLAMAILAPSAVFAGTLNNVTPKCDMKVCKENSVKTNSKMNCCKECSMAANCKMECCKTDKKLLTNKEEKQEGQKENLQAKIQMYDKALQNAEKYVPGATKKGYASVTKTKELAKQIINIRKEKINVDTLPLKNEFKTEVTAIELKAQKGKITKQEAKEQLIAKQQEKKLQVKSIKDQFKNENKTQKDDIKVKKDVVIRSFKNFVISIDSKDSKIIEKSFNIYIQNINELNTMLQQLINQTPA